MSKDNGLEEGKNPSKYSTDPVELRIDTELTNSRLDSLEEKIDTARSDISDTRKWLFRLVIIVIILAFLSGGNCIEFIIKLIK